jgi:hypothetical protein
LSPCSPLSLVALSFSSSCLPLVIFLLSPFRPLSLV